MEKQALNDYVCVCVCVMIDPAVWRIALHSHIKPGLRGFVSCRIPDQLFILYRVNSPQRCGLGSARRLMYAERTRARSTIHRVRREQPTDSHRYDLPASLFREMSGNLGGGDTLSVPRPAQIGAGCLEPGSAADHWCKRGRGHVWWLVRRRARL